MNGRNLLNALDQLNSIGVDVTTEDIFTLKTFDELDDELSESIDQLDHLLYEELDCSLNENNHKP